MLVRVSEFWVQNFLRVTQDPGQQACQISILQNMGSREKSSNVETLRFPHDMPIQQKILICPVLLKMCILYDLYAFKIEIK